MENNIDIAKILEDCPKGTKLYSPLCGECTLEHVHSELKKIIILTSDYRTLSFHSDGRYIQMDNAECLLFPSIENRDWNKFQIPFVDGDILISGLDCDPFIFKEINGFGNAKCYCAINCFKQLIFNSDNWTPITGCRFATPEEKQELFKVIKENGYEWNPETKTLEKVFKLKFKVGDRVQNKNTNMIGTITLIDNVERDYQVTLENGGITYILFEFQDSWELIPKFKVGDRIKKGEKIATIVRIYKNCYDVKYNNGIGSFTIDLQNEWELIPNKFDISTLKPFDKVLVRNTYRGHWCGQFYQTYDENKEYPFECTYDCWKQCIPYEGNENLLGTTKDCNDFYKNW